MFPKIPRKRLTTNRQVRRRRNPPINDPARAGQPADVAKSYIIDGDLIVSIYPVHTRFDDLAWFAVDPDAVDEWGLPEVLAITATLSEMLRFFSKGGKLTIHER